MDLTDQLEAVDAGHLDVAEHEIDGFSRDQLERFDRIRGHQYVVADAPQDAFDRAAIEFLVIDDEDVILLQGWSPLSGGGGRSVGDTVWSGQTFVNVNQRGGSATLMGPCRGCLDLLIHAQEYTWLPPRKPTYSLA